MSTVQENEDACLIPPKKKLFLCPKERCEACEARASSINSTENKTLASAKLVSTNTTEARNINCFCESYILCLPDTECANSTHVEKWIVKRLEMPVDHHVENVPQPPRAQMPKQQPETKQASPVANSNGNEARKPTAEVKVGNFAGVALKFPGRNQKASFIYMAEVFSMDAAGDGLITVKHMLKRASNLYAWPDVYKQEYSSQTSSDIFNFSAPALANETSQFKFNAKERDVVKSRIVK